MVDVDDAGDGRRGWTVKVRRVDPEASKVWYDRRDGGSGWYRHPAANDVSVGEILFLPEDLERDAPERLTQQDWPDRGADIATVRRISDDGSTALLEVDGRLRAFPQRAEPVLAAGQTVALTEEGELGAILTMTPVDRLGLGREFEALKPEQLMVEPESIDVDLADFGGSAALVERATELAKVALDPERRLELLGVNPVKGILFSGPSGTGKTHLARALSRAVNARFYLVDGPEIINKWVGESEQRLRDLFGHAEQHAPAILFFDELDSIVSSRGPDAPEYASRFIGQFLTALDGFEASKQVLVVAATNLPGQLDAALLRPGRLTFKLEFSGHPSGEDRLAILRASARKVRGQESANWEALVQATEGWTAAELAMIWTEAGVLTVLDNRTELCSEDIDAGLRRAMSNREVSRRQAQRG